MATQFLHSSIILLLKVTRFCLIAVTLSLFSCSDDLPELDYSKVYLIKTEYVEGPGFYPRERYTFIYHHTYDSLGRISSIIKTYPDGLDDTSLYIYNDATSIIVLGSGAYHWNDTVFIELNEKGLMISEYNITHHSLYRYEYNDDGNCMTRKYYPQVYDTSEISTPQLTNYYHYDGGNLVKEFTSAGEKIDYCYYNDKVNAVGNINRGMPFKGKSSKNLMQLKDAQDYFDDLNRLKRRYRADNWDFEYVYY